MQVNWSYIGCTKEDEERIEHGWEDRRRLWGPRLNLEEGAMATLTLLVSKDAETTQWHMQAAFYLPGCIAAAEGSGPTPEVMLDRVFEGLGEQLDRLSDQAENLSLRREGVEGIVPLLERCRREDRSDVFFAWLAPLVGTLAAHVRRELRMYERQKRVPSGEVEASDILDTVLIRAYERFERRDSRLPFDLWLLRIADEALEDVRLASSGAPGEVVESLQRRVEAPTGEPREALRDRWVEWATKSETIALSDALPAGPAPQWWDSLDFEAKEAETERMLASLPRIQRQALVLHTSDYGTSISLTNR